VVLDVPNSICNPGKDLGVKEQQKPDDDGAGIENDKNKKGKGI
jgi:hypothetical protein